MVASTSSDDPTLPWRDSLPLILESARRKEIDGGGYVGEEKEEEGGASSLAELCRNFLLEHDARAQQKQSADDDGDHQAVPPEDVVKTVQVLYVRSLLLDSEFDSAVQFCKERRQLGSSNKAADDDAAPFHLRTEESYALYRLGRYSESRDLCRSTLTRAGYDPDNLSKPVEGDEFIPLGLLHTLAQSLYRLHDTRGAGAVYSHLVANVAGGGEEEEVRTNRLAVEVANLTFYAGGDDGGDDGGSFGGGSYDLTRNLAARLLLTSTSSSSVQRALDLLSEAEKSCRSALEEDGVAPDEIDEEVAPMLSDRALGMQLLDDRRGASRIYLELMKQAGGKGGGGNNGGPAMTAKHNLAVLSSVTSPSGALKQLPDLGGGSEGVAKVTPAQVRTVLYNRSLCLLRMNKHAECREALAALMSAIAGGSSKKKKKKKKGAAAEGGAAVGASLVAPPATRAEAALWSGRLAVVESELLRAEGKDDEADGALVQAMEVLTGAINERREGGEGKETDADDHEEALRFGLAELMLYRHEAGKRSSSKEEEKQESKDEGKESKEGEEDRTKTTLEAIKVLTSLPAEIKSRPAVLGALSNLYGEVGMDDKVAEVLDVMSDRGGGGPRGGGGGGDAESAKVQATQLIKAGKYQEAVELLRPILDGDGLSRDDALWSDLTARFVQALSYVDPVRAGELAASLAAPVGEGVVAASTLDGEELEARETPRLSGKDKGGGGGGSRLRKMPGGAEADEAVDGQEKKAKASEAALRRRAKKRELYLQKLEREGRYNPDRPTKPDPERWIPKAQRSYGKRGRRGRHRFVGAQGGGTGAGAERDAARLDAAARAAARQEGGGGTGDGSPSKPSTAHMEVSGSGPVRRKGGRR